MSTTQIVAYVPLDAPEGSASVSVTTAANAVTEAKEVQVVADTPEILRLAPARAAPGTKVRVLGKFLDPPALAGASDGKPAITLDGTSVPTTMDVADKSLTFEVPKGKSVGDDVQVRVQRVDGKESPPEELTVVDPPVTP